MCVSVFVTIRSNCGFSDKVKLLDALDNELFKGSFSVTKNDLFLAIFCVVGMQVNPFRNNRNYH